MVEVCDVCGRAYSYVYSVPNRVWSIIAPNKETLGDYIEHQGGGTLCITCANIRAENEGVRLIFEGIVFEFVKKESE